MSIATDDLSALPRRHYGVILADPPWKFVGFSEKRPDKASRDASRHYRTMTIDQIKAMPIRDLALPSAHLMLWCSWPFLKTGLDVIEAWGFRYSSSFKVWSKLRRSFPPTRAFASVEDGDWHIGTGHTTRKNTEFILLGRRGRPPRNDKGIRELLVSPVREHSRKPDSVRLEIERYAPGPYLELFARTCAPGWDALGDQVTLFSPPAAAEAEVAVDILQLPLFAR